MLSLTHISSVFRPRKNKGGQRPQWSCISLCKKAAGEAAERTTKTNARISTNDVSGIGASTSGTRFTPSDDSLFDMPIPGAAAVTCLVGRAPAPRVRRDIASP